MNHQGRVLLLVLIAEAIGCQGGICEEGTTRCFDDPQYVHPPGLLYETCVTIGGDASSAFWALDDCIEPVGPDPGACPGSKAGCRAVSGNAQTGYGLCYCGY
jgi:hypothetical protein